MIFKIPIKPEVRQYVYELVGKRDYSSGLKRGGKKRQQYMGYLGECVVDDWLGKPLPEGNTYDNGVDFINEKRVTFDVKTMGRPTFVARHYEHYYPRTQLCHSAQYYIFVSYNENRKQLEICGYAHKSTLVQKGEDYEEGEIGRKDDRTTFKFLFPSCGIEHRHLTEFTSLRDFKREVEYISK